MLESQIPQKSTEKDQFNDTVEPKSTLITKLGSSVLEYLYVNTTKSYSALNTDLIRFEISTEDSNQCLVNPYKIDTVKIYYVERDFNDTTLNEYTDVYQSDVNKSLLEKAYKDYCNNPSEINKIKLKKVQDLVLANQTTSTFYFKDSVISYNLGTTDFPAWLSTDTGNSVVKHITQDSENNTVTGIFELIWDASSFREGDYFICWTWTVTPAGDQFSSHIRFTLFGDTAVVTSIPSHRTKPNKYETLLERYLPETYKTRLTDNDLTPSVLDKLNKSVAMGFTFLEDLTNQIIDLYNARVIQEKLIPYLGNTLDVNLKSTDSALWRRQVINAVPLYKQKGTKIGLIRSLDTIGVKLINLTKLWQIISEYTWQEAFVYDGSTKTFNLYKTLASFDLINFEVYLRPVNEPDYIKLSLDYVVFEIIDGISTITWVGETLSTQPIILAVGDTIRVIYKYKEIETPAQQNLENYIRTLPLQDLRDERLSEYPLKNWNVRLIEESDPIFDLIIPTRHPFYDDIIFGKIRTEFPYSENLYNMDEYNGSIRNSTNPCDIDKKFLDECSSCLSSKFNIDVEITNLNNDRIKETELCITENVPFHSPVHNMNIIGGFNEFIQDPTEYVYSYVKYELEQFDLSGQGQTWFTRAMQNGLTKNKITRSDLASFTEVVSTTSGKAYNNAIMLYCDEMHFSEIGLQNDGSGIIEITSPVTYAGSYLVSDIEHNAVQITVSEPINSTCNSFINSSGELSSCAITFRVINDVMNTSSLCNIEQKNKNYFSDSNQNFTDSQIATAKDIELGTAMVAWTITISNYATTYDILNILPSGEILIDDPTNTLPNNNASGLTYEIKNETNDVIFSGSIGKLRVDLEAVVTVLNPVLSPISHFVEKDTHYQKIGANYYQIIDFVPETTDQFVIKGYSGGDTAGVNLYIYKIFAEDKLGYLSYRGLYLEANGDYETSLQISNGANTLFQPSLNNNRFKENFVVEINGNNYFLTEINGNSPTGKTTFTLDGPSVYWKTYINGGTTVDFIIRRFTKTENVTIKGQQYNLPEQTFDKLDRSGVDFTSKNIEIASPMFLNSSENNDQIVTKINHQESINFEIQYADGKKEKGEV